jgi:hypothetical protein
LVGLLCFIVSRSRKTRCPDFGAQRSRPGLRCHQGPGGPSAAAVRSPLHHSEEDASRRPYVTQKSKFWQKFSPPHQYRLFRSLLSVDGPGRHALWLKRHLRVHVACTERPDLERRHRSADRDCDLRHAEALRHRDRRPKNRNPQIGRPSCQPLPT